MKRLHLLRTVKYSAANVPKNLEAKRRLVFFTNPLFMDMPSAKPVSETMLFRYLHVKGCDIPCHSQTCHFNFVLFVLLEKNVFTPYYSETVLYSSSELGVENKDGISVFFYLQKIFPVCLFLDFSISNHFNQEVLLKKEKPSSNPVQNTIIMKCKMS